MVTAQALERRVWEVLDTIEDPELPITVTELGLIADVAVRGGDVTVRMIPTYSACPAIEVLRADIRRRLLALPEVTRVDVEISYAEPWTMDRMSERGRQRLIAHGLSMPRRRAGGSAADRPAAPALVPVECPFCGSTDTVLENPFGPTLCRAIHYCRSCRNPIERFKPPAD